MISTVLLLASLPQLITYETKAARLPVILAELSTRTGTKLECEPSFKNDVLVIRVDGVDAKTLLDKIAQAAVGKWSRQGDRIVLSPDVDRRKEQEVELLARRERDIQRMLDQFKKDLEMPYEAEKLHPLKAAIDERRSMYDQQLLAERASRRRTFGPLERLGMRSLIDLGARRLAEIQPGERLVVSPTPTQKQLEWPRADESVATFLREWNLYQGLFGAHDRGLYWMSLRMSGVMPTQLQGVDHIWLSVTDPLRKAEAARITVVNQAETFGFGGVIDMTVLPQATVPEPAPELPDVALKLDLVSELMGPALQKTQSFPRQQFELDRKVIDFISRPTKNEPLSMGSELYQQYAAARKMNLVALINDGAFGRGVIFKAETVKAFDQFLRPFTHFDEKDGWLVLTSSSPVEARRGRDDREAMERYIQSIIANKRITFEAKAEYVFQRPLTLAEGLGQRIALLVDQTHPILNQSDSEMLLRLYGSLSRDQRQSLLRGNRIPYQALSSAQRAVWEQLVYGAQATAREPQFRATSDHVLMNRMDGPTLEPTREWPRGIPAGATLGLDLAQDFELKPEPKDNMHFTGLYDVARDIFFEQNPDLIEGDIKQWRRPDTFTPFARGTFQFKIALDENFVWSASVQDLIALSGPVKIDQLPSQVKDWLKKQVDEMYRQKEAGMKYRLQVGGVRQVIPPPPPR